jgi:hypothetical protein
MMRCLGLISGRVEVEVELSEVHTNVRMAI